jgi:hypothetical protein
MVVWSLSAGLPARHGTARLTRLGRASRVRGCIRIGALLAVMGLVRLARAVRPRWRPLLAGAVLTVVGVTLRNGPVSVVFIPGILLLLGTPLVEAGTGAGPQWRSELSRELAGYATPAQRSDLEATLDRYPDAVTHEVRDILARQPLAAPKNAIPGVRNY